MMAYAVVRLTYLVGRLNPNISIFDIEHMFDQTNSIDFSQKEFKIAFGVEGFLDGR